MKMHEKTLGEIIKGPSALKEYSVYKENEKVWSSFSKEQRKQVLDIVKIVLADFQECMTDRFNEPDLDYQIRYYLSDLKNDPARIPSGLLEYVGRKEDDKK